MPWSSNNSCFTRLVVEFVAAADVTLVWTGPIAARGTIFHGDAGREPSPRSGHLRNLIRPCLTGGWTPTSPRGPSVGEHANVRRTTVYALASQVSRKGFFGSLLSGHRTSRNSNARPMKGATLSGLRRPTM